MIGRTLQNPPSNYDAVPEFEETANGSAAGWAIASLDKLAKVEWGNTSITKKSYSENGYPAISASGQDGHLKTFEWTGPGVVLSAIGARCGKCFLANGQWTAIKNTIVIQGNPTHIEHRYLFHYLNDASRWQISGSGQPFITLGTAKQTFIPLPPIAEQKRIVAKVEQVLARVNAARERLAKVPTILKRFRQSVLAAACSGRLTEDWRAERYGTHSAPLEPPETWRERGLSELCTHFQYGSSQKSRKEGTVPVLRMGNIQDGKIDWSDLVYSTDAAEIQKYSLAPNTVLFNRTNSPELVGKTTIYCGERPAIFAGYLIRVIAGPELDPFFLNLSLNSPPFKDYCQQVKTDGVSQSNINAKKLAGYRINWCPVTEQREIVHRVESVFKLADTIEHRAARAAASAEKLTQSVLAKAFRGELVPTEAELAAAEGRDYETAEALLDRIRRERARLQPADSPRRARATAKRESKTLTNSAISNGDLPSGPRANRQAVDSTPRETTGEPDRIERIDHDEAMVIVREAFAAGAARDREQAIRDVAAALGFERVSQRIRDEAIALLRTAVRRGILASERGQYSLQVHSAADYTRDHLIDSLLSAVNGVWTDREAAIRATARHLGHGRAGPAFQQAMRSAINGALRRQLLESNGPQIRKRERQ